MQINSVATGGAIRITPRPVLNISFSASATASFAPAVMLVEVAESHDLGLSFNASATATFSPALQSTESGETHDVGLPLAASAQGAFVLSLEHGRRRDIGISFAGAPVPPSGHWRPGSTEKTSASLPPRPPPALGRLPLGRRKPMTSDCLSLQPPKRLSLSH